VFGLETGGRTESILMPLLPEVRQHDIRRRSREAALIEALPLTDWLPARGSRPL
jgi:coproporphyrinogen III oxidase